MSIMRKIGLTGALAATALATTTPAMAQDYRRDGDNTAALAIGAGVVGLALGAILASGNDRHRDYPGHVYTSGWDHGNGWYADRDGRRRDRADYARYRRDDRDPRADYRRGYDRDRGEYRRGY